MKIGALFYRFLSHNIVIEAQMSGKPFDFVFSKKKKLFSNPLLITLIVSTADLPTFFDRRTKLSFVAALPFIDPLGTFNCQTIFYNFLTSRIPSHGRVT